MTDRKPTLRDIDGTVPGYCMLVSSFRARDGELLTATSTFEEGPECPDPFERAQREWRAVEDDSFWLDYAYIMNDRARFIMWKKRMDDYFLPDEDPYEMYLSI